MNIELIKVKVSLLYFMNVVCTLLMILIDASLPLQVTAGFFNQASIWIGAATLVSIFALVADGRTQYFITIIIGSLIVFSNAVIGIGYAFNGSVIFGAIIACISIIIGILAIKFAKPIMRKST